jgi:hypothetical protein
LSSVRFIKKFAFFNKFALLIVAVHLMSAFKSQANQAEAAPNSNSPEQSVLRDNLLIKTNINILILMKKNMAMHMATMLNPFW